ncbi:MAG TPA: hypothetical protein VIG74_05355, partial [Alphaproteobacteria bacterium]
TGGTLLSLIGTSLEGADIPGIVFAGDHVPVPPRSGRHGRGRPHGPGGGGRYRKNGSQSRRGGRDKGKGKRKGSGKNRG